MSTTPPLSHGFRLTGVDAEPQAPLPYRATLTTAAVTPRPGGLLHPSTWFRPADNGKLQRLARTLVGGAASPDVVEQAVRALVNVPSAKRATAALLATELYPDHSDVLERIESIYVTAHLTGPDADFVRNARQACAGCSDVKLPLEVVAALRETHPHVYSDGAYNGMGGHVVRYSPAYLAEMDALNDLWSGIDDAEKRRALLGTFVSLEAAQRVDFVALVNPLKCFFNYPSLVNVIAKLPPSQRYTRCQEFLQAS